jgi:tetratricopeptide (TPR) repeat protein
MLSASENAAASRILKILRGHTLALKLTAAYAAVSRRPLVSIAAELANDAKARDATSSKAGRQFPVQLAFYQSVRELSNDDRHLFAILAIFRSNDIGRNAILEVAKAVDIGDAKSGIDTLARRAFADARLNDHIPIPADRDRIVLHPLLRALAEEMLGQVRKERRLSAERAAAHYYAEYISLIPGRWLAPDEANIIGALAWAHEHGEHELVASLCDGMRVFWETRGRDNTSRIYLAWGEKAAHEIARKSGEHDDWRRAARLSLGHGAALAKTWQFPEAESTLLEYRLLQQRLGDRKRERFVLTSMGLIAKAQGRLTEARQYFDEALDMSIAEQDDDARAANLMYLGQVAQARGEISEAEEKFQQALALFRESESTDQQALGNASSEPDPEDLEADDFSSFAHLEPVSGHWREAEALFQQGLSVRQENGDLVGEAIVNSLLGQLCIARGDFVLAKKYLKKSLDLRDETGDHYGEAVDLCQFGRFYLDKGEYEESRRYFRESLEIFRTIHARSDEGATLSQIALVAIEQRQYDEATALLDQSMSVRREVQDLRGEGVDHSLLGRIALEQGHDDKAEALYARSLEIAREIENRRGEGVNLRQLGVIAERRQHFPFAEDYYRGSLEIAREVENGGDIAEACLALGSFLCELRRSPQEFEEGCTYLAESADLYHSMQVPGEERARSALARLGCAQ